MPFAVGARLSLAVKHPRDGATFSIDVSVRLVAKDPPGIGVEFDSMS